MKLLRNFSLYTFIGFLNAGIGFLLLPVLTRHLTPEDYGTISLINVYVSILTPILGLSTSGFLSVEYYNSSYEKKEFSKIFSSVRIIPIITIVPLLIIFWLGQGYFPELMELPLQAYWLIIPMLLFTLFHGNFTTFLLTTKRAKIFSITTIAKIFIEISLTLFFLIYLGYGWDGRIYSALITAILFTGISVWFYDRWKLLSTDIRKTYIRAAIIFGAPLILHQIGKFVINQSDRLFLAKMVSVEEMGVYSVGYLVGSAILIIVTAFSNFFNPFLFERLKRGSEDDKKEIIKVSYVFSGIALGALILLTFISPFIFRVFIGKSYATGIQYVFWIGLSYFFWSFYNIFSGYIFFLKKTKILGYLAFVNVGLNCLLNYFFIKEFGAIGAAYATCISFFIVAVAIGFIVSKLYPMPWFSFLKKYNNLKN
ncbi:MAG TPA: oligosaccharide flippase family protein [Chitinophagaceae bacterium]|nr:oligosaccharide flippase family protein [Chitinophagales bacterium]HPG12082.1 oligosaccharide flippase family protein [Chitinophagaceae bacterium]